MAVNLTAADLAVALRLVVAGDIETELGKLLEAASARIAEYAPGAPEAIANEAAKRFVGVLFDLGPSVSRSENLFRTSGAQALLAPWRTQRARKIG